MGSLTAITLGSPLTYSTTGAPGPVATLVDASGRVTFARTAVASRGLAGRLTQRGVRRGDRVLLRGPASANWVIAFWGVLSAGGVVVPVNPRWGRVELTHATALTEPVLVLSDDADSALPWAEIANATGDAPDVVVARPILL